MIGCRIVVSGPEAIRVRCKRDKSTGTGWPETFEPEGNISAVMEWLFDVDSMFEFYFLPR